MSGKADEVKGRVKEAAGAITDDDKLRREGKVELLSLDYLVGLCAKAGIAVGVRLAAPVLIVLLIVEVAIGLISRTAPSLSFMVIGYPIRIVVGLFLVAALIAAVPGVIESMLERALMLGGRTATAFR